MASFNKMSDSVSSIIGTKSKNNLLVVSSGIPSLDYVIGGGLPTGGIFVIESDVLGSYSRVLTKYFLAEGVVCKHDLLLFSADENPEEIVKALPQPCLVQKDDNLTKKPQDEMKIAWRYEGLKKVESSFDNEINFGHHFDLSRYIDADTIKEINITYCYLNQVENCGKSAFRNDIYNTVLSKIKNLLAKDQYKKSSKNKNILRISIHLLGSPIWLAIDCNEEPLDNKYGHDLIKFMYCLRILLRDTNAVAFITMPSHVFDDDHIMDRLLYSIDNAVRIESFAGSDKETNPVFNEYHGLFHLTKLSALYSLVPFVPSSLDLAFKLKRKKFVIEKLHLPPELQESSEREQDDITAVPQGCGGFRKKDIEF